MSTRSTCCMLVLLTAVGCSSPTTVSNSRSEPSQPQVSSPPHLDEPELGASTKGGALASAHEEPPGPPRDVVRASTVEERGKYGWLSADAPIRPLHHAMAPPTGYKRIDLEPGSFGAWLRDLPLRAEGTPVLAFDGRLLRGGNHPRVAAVAELDVGKQDLQQCADSVIRLHAEWMWSRGRAGEIGYHFLSGDYASWSRYAAGDRPAVQGARVVWSRSASPSGGHDAFRRYLDVVFNYASTISLAQRRKKIEQAQVGPGDFFVLPGGPGHAVLILDMATAEDGRRMALLGQGFMPAQDFHVLRASAESPWFSLDGEVVETPFWEPFPWTALRRM